MWLRPGASPTIRFSVGTVAAELIPAAATLRRISGTWHRTRPFVNLLRSIQEVPAKAGVPPFRTGHDKPPDHAMLNTSFVCEEV